MKLLTTGWIFGLAILIVAALNFLLLKIILQYGFTSDDWWILFDYKIYGPDASFLDKYSIILRYIGLHHAYQIMYIGILESLFKGNYQAYQVSNIVFKILATISLYPLILAVFKRKLLAFLTTVLFAISYSSAGALLFVITGSDYMAIFFMNIFLLIYYYYFAKKRKILLPIASLLLFLAFMFSPIRMYPLLGFVILIEFFVWVESKKSSGLMGSIARLVVLFIPFLTVWQTTQGSTSNYLSSPAILYNFISYGNYQLLLTPFAGLGYTLLTNDYWSIIFGKVTFDSFDKYLTFLLRGPFIIYSVLAILISFLIAKKPLLFSLGIILINFIFQVISFLLVTNVRMETGPNIKYFNDVSIYAIFMGFFLISISIASLFLWFKNHKSNTLLLSLVVGPIFSAAFLWGTWLIKGEVLTFKEGIHWYMVTVAIGSCLFLATLMVLAFDRIKLKLNPTLKYILLILLFMVLLPIYLISKREINTTFSYLLSIGYKASDQEEMKYKLIGNIKDSLNKKSRLFYFETEGQKFYPISLLNGFEERMHFQDWEIVDGCVGLIYDKSKLEKSVITKGGVKGFNVSSLCVTNSLEAGRQEIFYSPDSLYAFKLKDRQVLDIREEILNKLGFQN